MTATGQPPLAHSVPQPAMRPLAGMHVLIAEDSWHAAVVTRRTIEQAGGVVVGVAATLAEAERLASTGCGTVVMDLNLNGEMAHELAGRLARQGLKVVVVSGYTRPSDLDPGIHAFIEKPSPPDKLIVALAGPPERRG